MGTIPDFTSGEKPKLPADAPEDPTKYITIRQGIVTNQEKLEEMRRRAEAEGLNISNRRRMELCDHWQFIMRSEPIQRGIDFGLVTGGLVAVGSCNWPRNRVPHRFLFFFTSGFGIGMLGVPLMVLYRHASNDNKRRLREKSRMARNREEFMRNQINS